VDSLALGLSNDCWIAVFATFAVLLGPRLIGPAFRPFPLFAATGRELKSWKVIFSGEMIPLLRPRALLLSITWPQAEAKSPIPTPL
jgi:hypothetical protein